MLATEEDAGRAVNMEEPFSKDEIISFEALYASMRKCRKGVSWKDSVASYCLNGIERSMNLSAQLQNGTYRPAPNYRFRITSPKPREIASVAFRDRVYQRSLNDNVVYPVMTNSFIYDNFACQKGKGTDAARERLKEFLRKHYRKHGLDGYVAQFDIHGYYPNMNHEVTEKTFQKKLSLEIFEMVLDVLRTQNEGEAGYFAGSQLIQIAGISVLDGMDHFIKEKLGAKLYIRYMDDFVFWSNQKEDLIALRRYLVDFIHNELDLEFKQEPFINRTIHGMDFLGMRIFPNAVRLSRQSRVRYQRKMKAYDSFYLKGVWDDNEYQARITALTAFADQAQSRAWRRKILAICEEHRAITVSCAGAAGTTTPGTAAPPTATGTGPATATTTVASASVAPQHRRIIRAVPADGRFPVDGTNDSRCSGIGSDGEDSRTFYYQGELWHR